MTFKSKCDLISIPHRFEKRRYLISSQKYANQSKQYTIARQRCLTALLLGFIATAYSLAPSNYPSRTYSSSSIALKARSKTAVMDMEIQQVKPRKAAASQRQRVTDEMMNERDSADVSKVALIDESMLEMILDNTASETTPLTKRPKGSGSSHRVTNMVPGAMSYKALLKYYQGQEKEPETIQNMGEPLESAAQSSTNTPKRGRGRPRKTIQSELKRRTTNSMEENQSKEELVNGINAKTTPQRIQPKRSKTNTDLKQYFETELLTAKEEYFLGTQVEFMGKCESVHEGLSINLGRIPTILEWAHACG